MKNKEEKRVCLGFGPLEGKCTEVTGTPWTKYWCLECDKLRRDTISAKFEALAEGLAEAKKERI